MSVAAPAASVTPPRGHTRFPLIDALRALAALSIVVFHTTQAGYFAGQTLTKVTAHLNAGVPLFFVISGFVLFRPYIAAARLGATPIRLRVYAVRRVLRIVPAYWACLLVAGAIVPLSGVFSRRSFLFFGFAQIYSPRDANGGLIVAWSLCTEMSFYALLPLISWIVLGISRRSDRYWHWVVLATLAVPAGGAVVFHRLVQNGAHQTLGISILGSFYLFYVGMALAVMSIRAAEDQRTRRLLNALGRSGLLLWLVALAAFLAIAELESPTASGPVWPPYGLLAGLILLPAIAQVQARPISDFLSWRPLAFVGSISYGVYLWHVPVLAVLGRYLPNGRASLERGAFVLALCVATSLAIAWLSYRLIEAPCIDRGRRDRSGFRPGGARAHDCGSDSDRSGGDSSDGLLASTGDAGRAPNQPHAEPLSDGAVASLAARCTPAIRDYVATVCGSGVSPRVAEQALETITEREVERGGPLSSARMSAAVRTVALAQAGRSAASMQARLRHLCRGRIGHAKVPDLLQSRAAGAISRQDLNWLYRTLRDCPDCGRLASALDGAEWRLNIALAEIEHRPINSYRTPPLSLTEKHVNPVAGSVPFYDCGSMTHLPKSLPPTSHLLAPARSGSPRTNESPSEETKPAPRGLTPLPFVVLAMLLGGGCALTAIEAFGGTARGPRAVRGPTRSLEPMTPTPDLMLPSTGPALGRRRPSCEFKLTGPDSCDSTWMASSLLQ